MLMSQCEVFLVPLSSDYQMANILSSLFNHLDKVAVFAGGLFTGSAFFVTFVEVPASRASGLAEYWRFFPYLYERAAVSQPIFTLVAGATGISHGMRILDSPFHRKLWITAGLFFLTMLPYTLLVLAPINRRIINDNELTKASGVSQIDAKTKQKLLQKWANLHLVRTVGSVAGFGTMIFGFDRWTVFVSK